MFLHIFRLSIGKHRRGQWITINDFGRSCLEEQRTDGRTSGMNNRCELALFMRIHSWLPRDLSHLNGGPTWAPNRVLLSHFWVRCLPQSGATPIYHLAPEGANRKSIFFGRGFSTGLSGPLRRCSSMCTSKSKGMLSLGDYFGRFVN